MVKRETIITICTVSFRSRNYLEINWELIRRLNRSENSWKWIVVENTPRDEVDRLSGNDDRFIVLPGIDMSQVSGKYLANYYHGAGLNKALASVRSRFLLVLDPDFFIVKKDWINEVIAYMINENLSFLGVPWHPKWYMKPRYFPCAHCLFIDLHKVDIQDLDFIPEHCDIVQTSGGLGKQIPHFLRRIVRPGLRFFQWWIFNRKIISSERDTGYSLLQRYKNDESFERECIVPVFRPRCDFLGPLYMISWLNRVVEKMLPERLCYIPKRPNYYSYVGFKEWGYPDLSCMEWEEFVWQGEPFGFHIRAYPKRECDLAQDKKFLLVVLNYFGEM